MQSNSKRYLEEQSSKTPAKQQKNDQDQVDFDSSTLQEPTMIKTIKSLNNYIAAFTFQGRLINNKYAQYEKLIFLELIKCIICIRGFSPLTISKEVCGAGSDIVYKYVSDTSSRWIQPKRKKNLLAYLKNNLDILKFFKQAGVDTGIDYEKAVELLIKYQDKNLSTRAFNNLGEKDKEFQQQIECLEKNIQISQQVNVPNANQQFITILSDQKIFNRVWEKSQQLAFAWPSQISTTGPSKQATIITKPKHDLNFELNTHIDTFKLSENKHKNLYVQYEELIFFKLIKCIQHVHHLSLDKISKVLGLPTSTIGNFVSKSSQEPYWIIAKFKKLLLTYLDKHRDIQQFYEQIGIKIQLDHALDIRIFCNYQHMNLFNQESYHSCQQDDDFQQQIRCLNKNIQSTQQRQNVNQQFIAIFDHKETFERVLEESKTRTINPHLISEEDAERLLPLINDGNIHFPMSNAQGKNLPSETISQLFHEYQLQDSFNATSPMEFNNTEVGSQAAQFSNQEDDPVEKEILKATKQFYEEYHQQLIDPLSLFNEPWGNNTTAVKGYQNNNLFAGQPKTNSTPILPKPGNTK